MQTCLRWAVGLVTECADINRYQSKNNCIGIPIFEYIGAIRSFSYLLSNKHIQGINICSIMGTLQGCCLMFCTNPGIIIFQISCWTATYFRSPTVRRTRLAGHCWRNMDELISNDILWTSTYGHTQVSPPTNTFIHQLCACNERRQEDLLKAIAKRVKRIRSVRMS